MIHDDQEFEPALESTAQELEQGLLFLGAHSTTGILRLQLWEGSRMVSFEIRNPDYRVPLLSQLIEAVGTAMHLARDQEAQAPTYTEVSQPTPSL